MTNTNRVARERVHVGVGSILLHLLHEMLTSVKLTLMLLA